MTEGISERPTFEQAFGQPAPAADSQAATPETTPTETVSASAATTEPPVSDIADPVTPAPEPPKERWADILKNTREKTRAEVEQEYRQKFGWAESVDRSAIEEAQRIGQLYQRDRAGYIRQVLAEAITDPNVAPLVRSEAARILGSRGQAQPQVDLSPDVPVLDANGNEVTRTYSAERVHAYVQHAVAEALAKEVTPLKQDFQTRQQRDQETAAKQEMDRTVQRIYADALDTLPMFKEHEAEIGKVMAALPADMDTATAVRKAWHQVVGSKLGLADKVRAQALDELKQKAAASTVNPSQAVVASTKRPKSFHDPSLTW